MSSGPLRIATKELMIKRIMSDLTELNTEKLRQEAHAAFQTAVEANLPAEVKKLMANEKTAGYLRRSTYWVDGLGTGSTYGHKVNMDQDDWVALAGAEAWNALLAAGAAVMAARKKFNETKRDLEVSFGTVNTYKQFRERFPELAKYLPGPASVTTPNLPATTQLIDKLKELGLTLEKASA